jgi:chromate transporter
VEVAVNGPIGAVAAVFLSLSLIAIGGANATIPEMHRQAVGVAHWMSDVQFADLFAISTAAPGPNFLIVTLIGQHVAGVAGAVVATFCFCVPTAALTYAVSKVWQRFHHARWRIAVQTGLVPLTTGLIAASAFVIARASDVNAVAGLVTLGAVALTYCTKVNPLWALGAGALLGAVGLV